VKYNLNEIYAEAGLTKNEVIAMPLYISEDREFYGTQAFEKLYEYFAFEICEMPYGVAKARTGDPDTWILEYLENRC
jgi:hypothetical protein